MKNKKRKLIWWIIGIILLLGIIAITYYYFSKFQDNTQNETIEIKEIVKPNQLEIKKMYFGDVFWGRSINDWAQASELKEKYPFSGLSIFNRENYQAWIGSLNCPITDRQISAITQEETLMFNCTPNYLTEAKKWFNIFSLANSHTDNQDGLIGFNTTRNYLNENNIQYFGHYNKEKTDEICEIITIKAKPFLDKRDYQKIQDTNYQIQEFFMPFAMCGYHNTFSLPTQKQLDEIGKYTKLFPTFVYAIQGQEYTTIADGLQQEYFRKMIDQGADAVIGKGAHVVQNTESYQGKPIIYSMGNFIYDQQLSADLTQGIGVEVKVDFIYDDNLEKWQEIASTCSQFKDDCLIQAQKLNLKKPNYKVYYDIVATDNSGQLAKKASAEIQEKMLLRTNWQETLNGLNNE